MAIILSIRNRSSNSYPDRFSSKCAEKQLLWVPPYVRGYITLALLAVCCKLMHQRIGLSVYFECRPQQSVHLLVDTAVGRIARTTVNAKRKRWAWIWTAVDNAHLTPDTPKLYRLSYAVHLNVVYCFTNKHENTFELLFCYSWTTFLPRAAMHPRY